MVLNAQKLCIWEWIVQYLMYKLFIQQYSQKYQFPFHHVDGDRWRRACEHVEKHLAQCMRDDHAMDQHMNAIVINLVGETTESESSDDNMWIYVFTLCLLFYEYKIKKEKTTKKMLKFREKQQNT